jgi:SAM-dependent methyltransferase
MPRLPELVVRPAKHDLAYEPSWDLGGERFLGPGHERVLDTIGQIPGLLYEQDAQKLYELAWFAPGPVLEIGTFCGQSTAVMAKALAAASNPARIVSVEVDRDSLAVAREKLDALGLGERVTLVHGDLRMLLRAAPRLRPGLVFVDGDHTLRGALADLRALEPVVARGAIVALHDFEGYEAEDAYAVRVAEAAARSWLVTEAQFIGRFGLSGLFVRRRGGPDAPAGDDVLSPPYLGLETRWSARRRRLAGIARKLDRRAFYLRRRLPGG